MARHYFACAAVQVFFLYGVRSIVRACNYTVVLSFGRQWPGLSRPVPITGSQDKLPLYSHSVLRNLYIQENALLRPLSIFPRCAGATTR